MATIGIGYVLIRFWPITFVVLFVWWLSSRKNSGSTSAVPKSTLAPDESTARPVQSVHASAQEKDLDDDVTEIMKNQDLDREEAEHVRDIMEQEGLDEDEAAELRDEL